MIAAAFVTTLALLIALPLVPSLRTWALRIDSRPLRIRDRYAHELHRASETMDPGSPGRSFGGSPGVQVHGDHVVPAGSAVGGLLVHGTVSWEAVAQVDGWLHATGAVLAGTDSRFHGSVTAGEALRVGSGTTFERLAGAPVEFSGHREGTRRNARAGDRKGRRRNARRNAGTEEGTFVASNGDRTLVDGDLVVERDEVLDGSLVVHGSLTVRDGATVNGSVKCYGDITLGTGARIIGAAFSRGSIQLGDECFVAGPCVSDTHVRLGIGSTVGTQFSRATVAAPRIEAHPRSTVFGIVHATEAGHVA